MAFALPGMTNFRPSCTVIATNALAYALSCTVLSTCPAVISTCPRCHLERSERSHAAIIRPKEGILGNTRFLASLRNDSGGCISAFALSGTTRFLAALEMTGGASEMTENHSKTSMEHESNETPITISTN